MNLHVDKKTMIKVWLFAWLFFAALLFPAATSHSSGLLCVISPKHGKLVVFPSLKFESLTHMSFFIGKIKEVLECPVQKIHVKFGNDLSAKTFALQSLFL